MNFRGTSELKFSSDDIRNIRDAEEEMGYRRAVAVQAGPQGGLLRAIFRVAGQAAIVLLGAYAVLLLIAGIVSTVGGNSRSSAAPNQAQPPASLAEAPREAVNIEQLPITRPSLLDLPVLTEPLPAAAPDTEPQPQAEAQADTEPPWEAGTPPPGEVVEGLPESLPQAQAPVAPPAVADPAERPGENPRLLVCDEPGRAKMTARKKKKKGFFLFRGIKAFGKGLVEGADALLDPNPASGQWP